MAAEPASVSVERRQVLAHRVRVQGLDRVVRPSAPALATLAVLDLGVQDTGGAAPLAIANRLRADRAQVAADAVTEHLDRDRFATVWSLRGTPHVHRRRDLPRLAEAAWPLSDADAVGRLGGGGKALAAAAAFTPLEGFAIAVRTMAATITEPMTKAQASAAMTDALPAGLKGFCKPCGTVHVLESLFRQTALPAGLELRTEQRTLILTPIDGWATFVAPARPTATRDVVRAYLRLLGPATEADAAALLGTTPAAVRRAWPRSLVAVRVGSREAWLAERDVAELRTAPEPDLVRLLPPYDPYLRGWDRDVLVPDRAHQRAVWKAIGNPGVVLVDGEIRGTWRPKARGSKVSLTVTPFAALPKRVVAAVEAEAELVGAVRGATEVEVAIDA